MSKSNKAIIDIYTKIILNTLSMTKFPALMIFHNGNKRWGSIKIAFPKDSLRVEEKRDTVIFYLVLDKMVPKGPYKVVPEGLFKEPVIVSMDLKLKVVSVHRIIIAGRRVEYGTFSTLPWGDYANFIFWLRRRFSYGERWGFNIEDVSN